MCMMCCSTAEYLDVNQKDPHFLEECILYTCLRKISVLRLSEAEQLAKQLENYAF